MNIYLYFLISCGNSKLISLLKIQSLIRGVVSVLNSVKHYIANRLASYFFDQKCNDLFIKSFKGIYFIFEICFIGI